MRISPPSLALVVSLAVQGLAADAAAGDVRFTFVGSVGALAPAPAVGPLAGAAVGDAVSVHLDVELPASAGIPGLSAGYDLDVVTSSWTIGGASGGFTLGGVLLFDGFPAGEDWVRCLNQQIAPGERLDIALDDATANVLGSPDALAILGSYPAAAFTSTSFEFTASDGGVVQVLFDRMDVTELSIGATYCSPAVPNSTGRPASVGALGSNAVAANDVTLAAWDLPMNSFGYFIASRTQGNVPGAGGSQGTLCLGGSIGRFNAQVMSSGAEGVIAIDPDLTAFPQPTGFVPVLAGETWSFQAWYRDANPVVTSNFSDGVAVTFQ